jgi:hypothetical protein
MLRRSSSACCFAAPVPQSFCHKFKFNLLCTRSSAACPPPTHCRPHAAQQRRAAISKTADKTEPAAEAAAAAAAATEAAGRVECAQAKPKWQRTPRRHSLRRCQDKERKRIPNSGNPTLPPPRFLSRPSSSPPSCRCRLALLFRLISRAATLRMYAVLCCQFCVILNHHIRGCLTQLVACDCTVRSDCSSSGSSNSSISGCEWLRGGSRAAAQAQRVVVPR